MTKTRQRTSSVSSKTKTKQNTKIAKPRQPLKVKVRRTYGSCMDCKQNLQKWGVGGSIDGVLCPPCSGVRVRKDYSNRRDLPSPKGVLITHGGYRHIIPLTDIGRELGGGQTCELYHTPVALKRQALQPCYNAVIRDNALNEGLYCHLPYNPLGIHIVQRLGCFDERSTDVIFGNVVITGPAGLGLFPQEIDKILKL